MPLTYTGPADVVENLKIVFRAGLPQDMADVGRSDEDVEAFCEILALSENQLSGWIRQSSIATASGLWLDEHGKDRNVYRQSGEIDDPYRDRMIIPPTSGTSSSILEALQSLLNTDAVYLIELPRQSCFLDRKMGFNRGHRMGGGRGVVIALIPVGDIDSTPAVQDLLRARASAGKITQVETYTE